MARPHVREISFQDLSDEGLVKLAVHVLRELRKRVGRAFEVLDMYTGCSVEVTWVKNKIGRKYYYPYLKCKDGTSIYLGNKPGLRAKIQKIKSIKSELRTTLRILRLVNELMVWIGHLNYILPLTKTIEEQVEKKR